MRHPETVHFFTFLAFTACLYIVAFFIGRWSYSPLVRFMERWRPPRKGKFVKRGPWASPNHWGRRLAFPTCLMPLVALIVGIIYGDIVLKFP